MMEQHNLCEPAAEKSTSYQPGIPENSAGYPFNGSTHLPVDLNGLMHNRAETCCMRVNSDVMKGAGIRNGDTVVIDRSLQARNGKVVIAVLNGEMLIRRFEKTYNKTRLLPGSATLSAIEVDASSEDFVILGVVTYVIRSI